MTFEELEERQVLMAGLSEFFEGAKKIIIGGVGNEFQSDAGFGCRVVRGLKKVFLNPNILAINCETMPERCIDYVDVDTTHVLFLEAVDMGEKKGVIKLFIDEEEDYQNQLSTNSLPPEIIFNILKKRGIKTGLLALQVDNISPGEKISPEVQCAVNIVQEMLAGILSWSEKV